MLSDRSTATKTKPPKPDRAALRRARKWLVKVLALGERWASTEPPDQAAANDAKPDLKGA